MVVGGYRGGGAENKVRVTRSASVGSTMTTGTTLSVVLADFIT
jgi:hypothetical protein